MVGLDGGEVRKPVKSHTLTGVCRTVGKEETLVKVIVHHVCGIDRFTSIFLRISE